ncbi:efflux RND transporter permease subunit [Gynuella sp.]|uniref:efflux RND transporter permease subunit n=1 Tax=Gynuella sp. TaxID=2969146 RepID=UPI003D0DCAD7
MNGLISSVLARSRTVVLLSILLFISGLFSFMSISKESMPDVTIPVSYISMPLKGVSPEDADAMLVSPMEKEIKSIEGLSKYTSVASEGHASITLEFDADVDIDQALSDTREAVDRVKGELPSEADDPTVHEINVALFPILSIAISGNVDERVLKTIAENLQEKLEALPSVLEANINGTREEVAEIVVDPQLMASYNLSHSELINLITSNNQLITAGNLDTGAGRFAVKVPGLIETEEEILNLPVKVDGTTVVRFRDVAFGQRSYKDRETISRVNGQPAVTLEIVKRVGQNIIGTVDDVKKVVEETQSYWPSGIKASFFQDQSTETKSQLSDLFNNVLFATILVFVVCVSALGLRSGFLVGLAIPTSFLSGILILNFMGYTLNMVALFGLIMTVGMLVDGAIVVTEYADRRMNEGAGRRTAYREAAVRMAWPIISSTATTLVVFLPLLFWPGVMGEFMKYLPITILVTLTSSLVVALLVIPTFGFLVGKPSPMSEKQKAQSNSLAHGDLSKLTGGTRFYVSLLKPALNKPYTTFALVCLFAVNIFIFFVGNNNGIVFFPEMDSSFGSVAVRARGNLSLEEKDALVKQAEGEILGMPELETVYSKTSASPIRNFPEDTIGVINVEMIDWQLRRPSVQVLNEMVARTSRIPGIEVEKHEAQMGPTASVDMQLELVSDNLADLQKTTAMITQKLNEDPRFVDVSDNLPLEGIEWQVDVDREAASRYGASLSLVGSSIKMVTGGLVIGSYRPDDTDDELDILLRYPYNGRNLDQIDTLTVTVNNQQVPISNFMVSKASNKKGEIFRTDSKMSLKVNANAANGQRVDMLIADLGTQLKQMYDNGEIPSTVAFKFIGDQEDQAETGQFLLKAFGIALFLMIIVLVTQFNSLYQTILVLSAVFFSTAGVLLGLLVTGEQFGIVMCGVGIIALAGIVVNNNIVLIDTFNVIREQNVPAVEAALLTCAQRLRPILLTTITTILGLVPMVFQWNIDFINRDFTVGAPSSAMWSQLSTAIAGGLTFTTILTLFLTPALLVIKERRVDRKRDRLEQQQASKL